MALPQILGKRELQTDEKKNCLLNYNKPSLIKLGSITDLTAGAKGSLADNTCPGCGIPRG
jgi:hypothetical protein